MFVSPNGKTNMNNTIDIGTLQELHKAADILASLDGKRIETPHGILTFVKSAGCNACGAEKPVVRGQRFCLPCGSKRKAENAKAAMDRLLAKRRQATLERKLAKAAAKAAAETGVDVKNEETV